MTNEPKHYEVLLAVTGGIAAYKSAALCSQLHQKQVGVTVAMTANAERFVGRVTFSALSSRKVHTDLFSVGDDNENYSVSHISLTKRADLIVVAPATANIIAKMAAGICDDLVSALLCAADSDILIAPSMNERMWNNPATQRNIKTLRETGVYFVGPQTGALACGTKGIGRMCEPEEILAEITKLLEDKKPKDICL
ncbi:MAG: phosphopantothenoylcysteine decarboxylase [Sedimentisphaerales bacterium]|nr:phosphopantothenoylcysteine decarboxylase [Sedimentisphaerales bacterium]